MIYGFDNFLAYFAGWLENVWRMTYTCCNKITSYVQAINLDKLALNVLGIRFLEKISYFVGI